MHTIQALQNCIECGRRKYCLADYIIGEANDIRPLNVVQNVCHPPGKTIFAQGHWVKSLFFIKSGSVKSVYTGEDGEQQIIDFYFSGEVIGPASLKHSCHLSSAIALEHTVVCAFPTSLLLSGFEALPTLRQNILSRSEAETAHQHETLLGIKQRNAFQRLGYFLLDLIQRQDLNRNNAALLRLSMTRADIANYLGLAPETISRTLSKFKDEDLILTQKKQLRVNDILKLSRLVG